jgi:hypothetical protein
MRCIVDAFGCTPPVDGLSEVNPHCPFCLGTGYVCDEHPNLPWEGMAGESGCPCGAPGMPCWDGQRWLGTPDGRRYLASSVSTHAAP